MRYFPRVIPKQLTWHPVFCEVFQQDVTSSTNGGYCLNFRLNSIFDPRVSSSGTAVSVVGLSQMDDFYQRYRVYAASVEVSFTPNAALANINVHMPMMSLTTANQIVIGVGGTTADNKFLRGTLAPRGYRNATPLEWVRWIKEGQFVYPGYNKFKAIDYRAINQGWPTKATTLKMYYKIPRLALVADSKVNWKSDNDWAAYVTDNPVAQIFCAIWLNCWAEATSANYEAPTGRICVKIQYHCTMHDRASLYIGAPDPDTYAPELIIPDASQGEIEATP